MPSEIKAILACATLAKVLRTTLRRSMTRPCSQPTRREERKPRTEIDTLNPWEVNACVTKSYKSEKRLSDGTEVFIGAIITSPKSVLFTERNTP
jgi:hypothetical protein